MDLGYDPIFNLHSNQTCHTLLQKTTTTALIIRLSNRWLDIASLESTGDNFTQYFVKFKNAYFWDTLFINFHGCKMASYFI